MSRLLRSLSGQLRNVLNYHSRSKYFSEYSLNSVKSALTRLYTLNNLKVTMESRGSIVAIKRGMIFYELPRISLTYKKITFILTKQKGILVKQSKETAIR